jgi:hypothetical protein
VSASSQRLPHVDEHSVAVEAGREATWEALLRVAEGTVSGAAAPRYARLVGCADTTASGPRPLAAGSTVPGFHVEAMTEPSELALAGSHRFSNYALIFRLDELEGGGTRVRAETRAEFPGAKGAAYRGLVIGTRMHVLATRRILAATKRRAERH